MSFPEETESGNNHLIHPSCYKYFLYSCNFSDCLSRFLCRFGLFRCCVGMYWVGFFFINKCEKSQLRMVIIGYCIIVANTLVKSWQIESQLTWTLWTASNPNHPLLLYSWKLTLDFVAWVQCQLSKELDFSASTSSFVTRSLLTSESLGN